MSLQVRDACVQVVSLGCGTDFAARSSDFLDVLATCARTLEAHPKMALTNADLPQFLATSIIPATPGSAPKTVQEMLDLLTAKTQEKCAINALWKIDAKSHPGLVVGAYLHGEHIPTIGLKAGVAACLILLPTGSRVPSTVLVPSCRAETIRREPCRTNRCHGSCISDQGARAPLRSSCSD